MAITGTETMMDNMLNSSDVKILIVIPLIDHVVIKYNANNTPLFQSIGIETTGVLVLMIPGHNDKIQTQKLSDVGLFTFKLRL